MKKTQLLNFTAHISIVAMVVLAVLFAAGCSGKKQDAAVANGEIQTVYAATGGVPRPFTYVNESGTLVGHNIELIKAVFERLPQYELEIEVTDIPSIFPGLDSDRYQLGVNNFAMNEERKAKYIFSDPIFRNQYVAVTAANNTAFGDQIKSLSDLAGKSSVNSVGINVATALENYNKANPNAKIVLSYTDADLLVQLQQVEDGTYDFALIDKPMFEFYLAAFKLNLKGVDISPDVSSTVMNSPFSYFLISKGNEKLAEDINGALKKVIADGTSKKINEKYFGSDFSPDVK